jgi:DNA mismatch repair ATPase MutS
VGLTTENNFLVALDKASETFSLAYMDLSTGEFKATQFSDFSAALSEISSLKAREIVVGYELSDDDRQVFEKQLNVMVSEQYDYEDIASTLSPLENQVASKLLAYIKYLTKFPGVGKKTAMQMVLDLAGKFDATASAEMVKTAAQNENLALIEAIEALQALGYKATELKKIQKKLEAESGLTSEEYIKAALKLMMK